MKKSLVMMLILGGLLFGCAEAAAQYASLHRKGAFLYSDGMKLSQEQMQTLFEGTDGLTYADWKKAAAGFNTGKGLLIGFGALTGTGIITLGVGAVGLMVEGVAVGVGTAFIAPFASAAGEPVDIGYKSKFAGVATAGACMIGGGLLCMVAGTTVYCIYKKKLNRMTAVCNDSVSEVQLSFGMKDHGIGFSLEF